MNLGNLYEDEATPIAAVNDNSRCYLCQMDHQQPMIRLLDNIEFRLCGKIKDVELWKTMAEAYQEQMKVVAQQGLGCVARLSEDVFEHHYTRHHVCPKLASCMLPRVSCLFPSGVAAAPSSVLDVPSRALWSL